MVASVQRSVASPTELKAEPRTGSNAAGQKVLSDFATGAWQRSIDVRDFIQRNYTPYTGDETFLAAATERTQRLWPRSRI
jgi:formate C-acetyltransferase